MSVDLASTPVDGIRPRVLITGGAGFLGINLVRWLLDRGWAVTTLDREAFTYPEAERVRVVTGDVCDWAAVVQALDGAEAVVHAAAALPLHTAAEIHRTDVIGTQTVLAAADRVGIERVVHISSTAVYGVPEHHPLVEDDPLVGVGPYGNAKIDAERLCAVWRRRLTVPVLRPKSFIGPERLGVFALLYDWASTGHHFPIPGHGDNRYQYLDVADLCAAIERCLTLPRERVNTTFNVGAAEFDTFRDDFQAVLDHAGYGGRVVGLPAGPALWALRLLDRVGLSPLYPWVYETAVKDSFVSIERARCVLDWEPRFSNTAALIRNYDWYVAHVDEFAGQAGRTHRVPWRQGALALAKRAFVT